MLAKDIWSPSIRVVLGVRTSCQQASVRPPLFSAAHMGVLTTVIANQARGEKREMVKPNYACVRNVMALSASLNMYSFNSRSSLFLCQSSQTKGRRLGRTILSADSTNPHLVMPRTRDEEPQLRATSFRLSKFQSTCDSSPWQDGPLVAYQLEPLCLKLQMRENSSAVGKSTMGPL